MEGTLTETMVPAMYSIKYDQDSGIFYAEKTSDNVKLPSKVFDTGHNNVIGKIIKHYLDTDKATGCVFHGPAGVGKSITSQTIQNTFITELKKPVYVISEPFVGQDFMDFINDLGDGLFVFDEFEKQYDLKLQEKLLPLFDGADSKVKRLAIIIVNIYDKLSGFYKNRTGRSRYNIKWETLPIEFIKSYLDSELNNKSYVDDIFNWVENNYVVTFDNLEALVRECNEYPNEPFDENVKYLNVSGKVSYTYYKVLYITDHMADEDYKLNQNDYPKYLKIDRGIELNLPSKTFDGTEETYFNAQHFKYFMDGSVLVNNGEYSMSLLEVDKEEYEQAMTSN
jgi:hypothetical protein